MEIRINSRIEGDINGTDARGAWQDEHLSEETLAVLEQDSKLFLHQSMSTPCLNAIVNAEGIYIEDQDGRRVIDFHGNSVHQVGYKNEYVMNAIIEQMQQLPFLPRRYTSQIAIKLAQKLVDLAPGDLNKVLFAPGGTSAIGIALKLARRATGKHKTISTWDSFHGASLDAISVGGEAVFRSGIGPLLSGTEHMMPYNSYRSIFGEGEEANDRNLDYLCYMLEREEDVCAVILEPIRSTDVQIPSVAYMQRLRQICDDYSVLLILDEIPTALGRTGTMFVHEHYGIVPDIVVIGKGFGGGIFPMAGIIAREHLDVAGDISLGHYTHEKSAVGCAAALATIAYIEQENLLEHARHMEQWLIARLGKLQEKYTVIGDVRVKGMLAGIELVSDRVTKEKEAEGAEKVLYECLSRGLSFKVSSGNVLTLVPPLITSVEQMEEAILILDQSLEQVFTI
ncbi:(R)-1-hydroxy-2-aminoethylphosphonate ammonia-lyase [Paenibacillus sinopodophylli]|uniref:(R)-1-hydroxy-2-aminoethylphosphonate ammonia-lyase n=1 Tax=Paenibacillus sinopodophylli TaxID=1837342 RepID=UPI00110CEE7E|nr:aspartate aminotransferase family protein [Paenibacillus sinopodophylli]